jgi:hypothetical protein
VDKKSRKLPIADGKEGQGRKTLIDLMVENYRTDFIWNLMRQCPYLADGLRRAGFTGVWL